MNLRNELLIFSFLLPTLFATFMQKCNHWNCMTTMELSANSCTLQNDTVVKVKKTNPQHNKQFTEMKLRYVKTPHCFLNPWKDSVYKLSCFCSWPIGEACGSLRARGEALYQWKRDHESRASEEKTDPAGKNSRKVDCALEAIGKLKSERYHVDYSIDLTVCGSPPTLLSARAESEATKLKLRFNTNEVAVTADWPDAKLLVRNLEDLNDIDMPIRIIKGLVFQDKLSTFEDRLGDAQCVLRSFWRLVESRTSLGVASNSEVRKIGDRRLKYDVRGDEDPSLVGTSAICWMLMVLYVVPVIAVVVAVVVREQEEPRLELPTDPAQYIPDVEDLLSDQYPPLSSVEDSPLSSLKKSKSKETEIVDIAISMQCDPNHTDLGSEATGEGMPVMKNVSPEQLTPKEDQIF